MVMRFPNRKCSNNSMSVNQNSVKLVQDKSTWDIVSQMNNDLMAKQQLSCRDAFRPRPQDSSGGLVGPLDRTY